MAKKKVNWEDLFDSSAAPSWAVQERQTFLNNDKKYNAMIDAVQEDAGVEFDAATRLSMLRDLRAGKPLNFAQAPAEGPVLPSATKPDFSNVEGQVGSTEEGTIGDTLRTYGATLRDALKTTGARFIEQSERLPSVGSTYSLVEQLMGINPAEVPRQEAAAIRASANDPLRVARTEQLRTRLEEEGGVRGFVGAGAVDVASSPAGLLSVIGGPTAAIAIADAYAAAYDQGKAQGLEGAELDAWAGAQAAPELVGVIPAGKLFSKLPVVGPLIEKRLATAGQRALGFADNNLVKRATATPIVAAANIARTALGEGVEEASTGILQDLAAQAFAGQEASENLRKAGEATRTKTPEEFAENVFRNFRAGVVGGTALSTPIESVRASRQRDAAKAEQEVTSIQAALANDAAEAAGVTSAYQAERDRVRAEEQALAEARAAFIGAPRQEGATDLPRTAGVESFESFADREAGLLEAENERLADAQEAFNRLPRVETAEGTERPTARGTESFEAFAERETAAIEQRKERASAEAEASTRLSLAKKKIAADEKNAAAAAKATETKRRDALAKQVAKDYADRTPAEQAEILADLIADPEVKAQTAKPEKTQEEKIQGIINQVEGLRKSKATQRVNNRIRSLYKADPTRTAQDIANILNEQEGDKTAEENAPSESDLAARIAALNKRGALNMDQAADAANVREQEAAQLSENGPVAVRTAEQQAAYKSKVKNVITALSRGNTQEGADITNLVRQGKLVLTDKAESIGRSPTTSAGQYSPQDGKMYVYLDNIDTNNPKASILATVAAHESGHAGQFNQREGRSELFKYLLGDKGNAAANAQIRSLAKSGNKLAQAAVNAAQQAARDNNTLDNVENLELVPYLFSEAKQNSPGRLGKIVRDAKNAARQTVRKFNANWDFSIDELAAAADKMAGEIVQTNLTPDSTETGTADMVMGKKAASPVETAKRYNGAVDGLERWTLSDRAADTITDAGEQLKNNKVLKLPQVLKHDELYKNYPQLRDYDVVKDESIKGFGAAIFRPKYNQIGLSPESVARFNEEEIRKSLLHETQHAVQNIEGFISGSNWKSLEDPMYRDDLNTANDRLDKVVERFDLGTWKATVPVSFVRAVERALPSDALIEQSEYVLRNGLEKHSSDRIVKSYGDNVYSKAKNAQNLAAAAYNQEQARAFNIYLRDYGEAEARTTEYASNMTQEELDNTNFEEMFQEAGRGVPVEQTVDAGGYFRGRRPSGALDMAARAPTTESANPKFSVKERINRILAHGRQERLDTVKIAEDLHSQFVDALKADTGKTELSEAMNKDMVDFLSNPEHTTVEGRERIVKEMKAKYPQTTDVLLEARDRISDMTMDTINDVLSTGRPLSITQRKNIATMLANKDTYMSRAYAAFQAGRGRKWSETRWNNFTKNIGKDADSITNPKVKADVLAVRDAVKVITNSLRIPDSDTMQDMTMEQLVGLANRHGIKESQLQYDRDDPDASWLKRDELISELEKVKAAYPEDKLEQLAMSDAKDILGLGDRESAYAKQMSDLARNPGTLKERQRVPLEIRRLLGEIELAPGAFMATMSNQAALRARAKVVSELINDPQGDIALTKETYDNLPPKEQKKYKRVDSEEWGGLNGMYLRDSAFNRMEEVTGLMYSWRDAAKRMSHDVTPIAGKVIKGATAGLGALNRWNKLMTVVYNPFSWAGNFAGSFLNMVGAGNFSPTAMSEGMGTAREYVGGTFKTTTTPRLSKVIRYMNLEAADIAELQNVLGNTLEKYFDSPSAFKESVARLDKHGHGLAGRAHKSVIAGYAIADNWSKIANFYHRYGVLKDMYDAADIKKTEDQILQEAGDDTSYTNISPERVHAVIRTAESAGLSQYAPYFAEVLRTRVTNVALAHKDFQRGNALKAEGKNKAANIMYRSAALRLAGQIVTNVGMPAVGAFKVAARLAAVGVPSAVAYSIANSLSALGGDDEENEKKRRMLSEMNRVQDLMQVGKNQNGYPIYLPYSQKLDPNGPFTDLMRAFVYADDYESLYKNLKASSLYIFPQILKDSYAAMANEKFPESDIGRVWPGLKQELSEVVGANDADRFLNVADNLLPGVVRAWKTQNTADGVAADPETKRSLELMNTAGIRFETLDPRRTLKGYSDVSNEDKATNNGVLNRSLLNAPTPTKKIILDATEQFFRSELERQKEDYKNVQSLRAWKFNDEQIAELLAQGGYPKKSIPNMVEGTAEVKLSLKSLLEYADTSGSYQDTREYEKRGDKAVQLVNMILEMEPELNELGITVDKSQMPKGWNE